MCTIRRFFLGMVTGLLLALTTVAPADAGRPTGPTTDGGRPTVTQKILIYGDSLTHSFNADWTWRYRLWQSLKQSQQTFDFVGPRTDVLEYTTRLYNSQGYRNPNFDRDHAALYGMQFLTGYYQPASLSLTYRPNVIVALVGGNDLLNSASVSDLETHWRQQIAKARLNNKGVDFLIVPIPHTWITGVMAYNDMLNTLATSLNTADERVVVAPMALLDGGTDTFDGAHLSTSGELKVAAVVSKGLQVLGIGNGQPVASSDPADDHTWAPQPAATVSETTMSVTWPAVTYASSENLWVRNRATGAVGVRRFVTGESATISGAAGSSYDLWLEPVKGWLPIGTTSDTIQVDIPAA